jgi:MFS family permease
VVCTKHSSFGTVIANASTQSSEYVQTHLKRNVAAQLINGMFGQTGFRLVQAPTFLPSYLFELSGSDLIVGLARSLQAAGTVLSPIIGASLIGHRPHILGTTLGLGVLMRANILGMALAGFALGSGALYPVIVMLMLLGFFQGMSQVTMNSLRAKVIPVTRRGIVSGARNFLAGLSSAIVSYVAGAYVIEQNWLGHGYASVFLLGFIIGLIGLAGLALTAEPTAAAVRERSSVGRTLAALPQLLREDRAFTRFFFARALGSFGRMAMPFYILYAATRMEVSGATLGLLTMVWMVTSSATNLFWGWIADRYGYKVTMLVTLAIWMLANGQIMLTSSVGGMIAFFTTMGMATGGFAQSSQNMVLEFGRTEDIPLRLAASGTAVNLVNMIGPLLGGAIVAVASYHAVFITCIVLQAIALGTIAILVPEPRRQRP